MELGDADNETAKSIRELKKKLADTKNAIEMLCNDKDVVLLLGNTGSGKSVLYNYLLNIPLKECSAADVGIKRKTDRKFITVDTSKKQIDVKYSEIGHRGDSLTETPVISVLDDMALGDCPGLKDNRGTIHLLANTVKMTRALKSGRSCKIIVVVTYNDADELKETSLQEISDRISRMFHSEDLFRQHCKSIRFLISQLPKFYEGEVGKAEDIQSNLLQSNFQNLCCIAANEVLIYDPLSRNDRTHGPIPTRDELIEAIKSIPSISNPMDVFGMGLSDSENLAIRKYEKNSFNYIDDLITKKEMLNAAIFYQVFFHLEVLEHETVKTACANLRKRADEILSKMREEYQEKANKLDAKNAKKVLEEFGTILSAFKQPGNDNALMQMWSEYKTSIERKGFMHAGIATTLAVVSASTLIFPPFIPFEVAAVVTNLCAGAVDTYYVWKLERLSEAEPPQIKQDKKGK